jgi:anti-sigma B factor antagonist
MQIIHISTDCADILRLEGRFDAYAIPELLQWFDQHPEVKRVVVNLSGVNFIDSSGLSTLVKGLKRCRQNGGDLVLSDLQQAVQIIIELTRLDKAFSIFENEAAAMEKLLS